MQEVITSLVTETATIYAALATFAITTGIIASITQLFLKGNNPLRGLSIIALILGAGIGIYGGTKTASIWKNAENVFYAREGWEVRLSPSIIPGTYDAVFQSKTDYFKISSSTYYRLQRKYPDLLPELNFSK